MRSQQHSPPYRVVSRGGKLIQGSPISGSTSEASDNNLKVQPFLSKAQPFSTHKNSKPSESHVVSQLRQELKTIKSSVAKLIQEEFVKKPSNIQLLQSSQSISEFSKNSQNSGGLTPPSTKKQEMAGRFLVNQNELQILREDYERLMQMHKMRDEKQQQINEKFRQLRQEVGVLRKAKQQLIKCVDMLKVSLKQTSDELKQTSEQLKQQVSSSNKQGQLMQQLSYGNVRNEEIITQLRKSKGNIEEELQFRIAQNNQLISIIEMQAQQLKNLNAKLSQSQCLIKNLQTQQLRNSRIVESSYDNVRRKAISVEAKGHILIKRQQIQSLYKQNQALQKQVAEKERVMKMMLKDIKQMDEELKLFDIQHQLLAKHRLMVDQLNQLIVKLQIKKLASKYKYY